MRQTAAMRWERLFDDLEAQFAAADEADLSAEISERTRIELGRQKLANRLRAGLGTPISIAVAGQHVAGTLLRAGSDVALLADTNREVIVALDAAISIAGLGRAVVPEPESPRAAAVDSAGQTTLRSLLRAVGIDRSPIRIRLIDGTVLIGTIDMVGADHLELAEHPLDEPRRTSAVTDRRVVPFSALATVRQH